MTDSGIDYIHEEALLTQAMGTIRCCGPSLIRRLHANIAKLGLEHQGLRPELLILLAAHDTLLMEDNGPWFDLAPEIDRLEAYLAEKGL